MDERRTLQVLGWTLGGVVGLMFVLGGLSLASLQPAVLAPAQNFAPDGKSVAAAITLSQAAPANTRLRSAEGLNRPSG